MEGSLNTSHLIIPVLFLFSIVIYLIYDGNSHKSVGFSGAKPVLFHEGTFELLNKKEKPQKNTLKCKLEEQDNKVATLAKGVRTEDTLQFFIYACPNWVATSKKMAAGHYSYQTAEFNAKSTCSGIADSRGPNQRVVSFAFYGDIENRRGYFQGIERNANLMQKYYPSWIMRLYHDIPPLESNKLNRDTGNEYGSNTSYSNKSEEVINKNVQSNNFQVNDTVQGILCNLMCTHHNLDLCYVGNIPGFGNLLGSQGNMWRFLPMADPLVDVFVSRDLDSCPSVREMAAVGEWLKSNLTFHIMRDHPYHSTTILAGMWGAAVYTQREKLYNLTVDMMTKGIKAKSKGLDQQILNEVVWPASKDSLMQHDSYFCKEFGKDRKTYAWPTRRNLSIPYNFVGSRMGIDVSPMTKICPEQCRPPDKMHWTHC